jgi:hypothetical protein
VVKDFWQASCLDRSFKATGNRQGGWNCGDCKPRPRFDSESAQLRSALGRSEPVELLLSPLEVEPFVSVELPAPEAPLALLFPELPLEVPFIDEPDVEELDIDEFEVDDGSLVEEPAPLPEFEVEPELPVALPEPLPMPPVEALEPLAPPAELLPDWASAAPPAMPRTPTATAVSLRIAFMVYLLLVDVHAIRGQSIPAKPMPSTAGEAFRRPGSPTGDHPLSARFSGNSGRVRNQSRRSERRSNANTLLNKPPTDES